jgi:hypothetical protein
MNFRSVVYWKIDAKSAEHRDAGIDEFAGGAMGGQPGGPLLGHLHHFELLSGNSTLK